jgi:DNA processing protein
MPEVMPVAGAGPRRRYRAPDEQQITRISPASLVAGARTIALDKQATLPGVDDSVFCAGDLSLAKRRSVAIVGSRKVSDEGARRAQKLARQLVDSGFVVVSGLAYGVDLNAHNSAIDAGGKTIAVIGTPLDKSYPIAHAELQERIYRDHLLVSPFASGSRVFESNFPQRNRLMAAISDATCIVEAGDTSGSLSQAKACVEMGRWLFILRSLAESTTVTWPAKFLEPSDRAKARMVRVVDSIDDILRTLT